MVPRRRHFEPGHIYHVLNRGTQRQQLFFSDDDYRRFEVLIGDTLARIPLRVLTFELMPNIGTLLSNRMIKINYRAFSGISREPMESDFVWRMARPGKGMFTRIASRASQCKATDIS